MPRFPLLISCVFGLAAVGFALPKDETPTEPAPPAIAERPLSAEDSLNPFVDLARAQRESEARLQDALQKPVTISFEKIPLKDAVKRFREKSGVSIWIDRDALQMEDFTDDVLVSCDAKRISLHKALKQMLNPRGLDYRIENEVITISTDILTDERLQTRHYEVADVLKWEEEHRYGRRALPNKLISTHRPHDWLQDLIEQETSGPWINLDGTGGTIALQGTVLSIRQPESVHEEIPAILEMLRLFTVGKLGKDRSVFLETLWQGKKDAAARRALAKRVSLNFRDTPLNEVAKQFTKQLQVPVVLDEQALVEEGVSLTEKVTLQVAGITANAAFRLLLYPLGLEAVISEGRILITSIIAADELMHSVAYDVRDLIQSGAIGKDFSFYLLLLWQETSGPWIEVDGTGGDVSEPLPGLLVIRQTESGQKELAKVFDGMREREKARKAKGVPPRKVEPSPKAGDIVIEMYGLQRVEKPKQVQRAIYNLVEPTSWKPNGGTGTIHIIGKVLVVRNTAKVHRQVHSFLLQMTRALEEQSWEFFDPQPPTFGDLPNDGIGNFGQWQSRPGAGHLPQNMHNH